MRKVKEKNKKTIYDRCLYSFVFDCYNGGCNCINSYLLPYIRIDEKQLYGIYIQWGETVVEILSEYKVSLL